MPRYEAYLCTDRGRRLMPLNAKAFTATKVTNGMGAFAGGITNEAALPTYEAGQYITSRQARLGFYVQRDIKKDLIIKVWMGVDGQGWRLWNTYFVLWWGWELMRQSIGGLMDEAVSADMLAKIRVAISKEAQGAIEAHDLRTRHAGRTTFIEFHLVVPGTMTVAESLDPTIALFDEDGASLLVNDHRNVYLGKLEPFVDVVIQHHLEACFIAVSNTPGFSSSGDYALLASRQYPSDLRMRLMPRDVQVPPEASTPSPATRSSAGRSGRGRKSASISNAAAATGIQKRRRNARGGSSSSSRARITRQRPAWGRISGAWSWSRRWRETAV